MPEGLALALATPGLAWVIGAAVLAGIVYGFAGFGAALVFMPIAAAFVDPVLAVAAFQVSALISFVTVVPRALPQIQRGTVATLLLASLIGAPIGVYLLVTLDDTIIRWAVTIGVAITWVMLVSGWRYKTAPGRVTETAVGAAAGMVGGSTGLNGPIVIIFQLTGQNSEAQTRANMIVFLTTNSMLLLPIMALQGALTPAALWLGAVLLLPYGAASLLGQKLFNPQLGRVYRLVAYAMIAAAVIVGAPVWG